MDQEMAFLVALRTAPKDEAVRLVYADWLADSGDARADYLRVATEALRRIRRGLSWDDLKAGLQAACETEPSEWREQTGPWFDVVLESFQPEWKLHLITLVRAIVAPGLWEAKMLVEAAPSVIMRRLPLEKGEAVRIGLIFGHLPNDREPQPQEQLWCWAVLRESSPEGEPAAVPDRPLE